MNLGQKKNLAEWMGYEIWNGQTIYKPETKKHENKNIEIENWNPDTDPKQFFEVYRKLCWNDKQKLFIQLGIRVCGVSFFAVNDFVKLLDKDLPAVMDAVLEVLEIKK